MAKRYAEIAEELALDLARHGSEPARKPARREEDSGRVLTPELRAQARREAREWGELRGGGLQSLGPWI